MDQEPEGPEPLLGFGSYGCREGRGDSPELEAAYETLTDDWEREEDHVGAN